MEELARNREKDHLLIQQSRLASMGEMVHNIAYQWRQPLNAASVIVQNIKTVMDWEELTNDYVNHAVSKSMKIMEHMSNTIDDFRNFFKPEKARSVFSLKDEINKTIAIIKAVFQNNFIRLSVQIDQDWNIEGYPGEFGQVLINLLNNSREALISRKIHTPEVIIESRCKGEIIISDNAGGIDETIMNRIFEPYFPSRKTGTGIGLYMSRMIIEKNMGGVLTVSNNCRGAEFRIKI